MPDLVILYDGTCAFCSRSVVAIHRRDPAGRFRFAALTSIYARGLVLPPVDSVILVEGAAIRIRWTAVRRILWHLGGWYRVLSRLMAAMPASCGDRLYDQVARRRQHLVRTCAMPTPGFRERVLA